MPVCPDLVLADVFVPERLLVLVDPGVLGPGVVQLRLLAPGKPTAVIHLTQAALRQCLDTLALPAAWRAGARQDGGACPLCAHRRPRP